MLNKKKVLGRGLSALIGDGRAHEAKAGQKYLICALSAVTPNKIQPRKTFNEAALKELSDSIKEKGIIEPLIVRRNPTGGFELIAGERRWRAARMAGLKEAPAIILDVSDEESLELAIIENIQREDLNAIEEAEAYRNLMGFGFSQEEVAKKVGKERVTVANYLRLLKLPPEVKVELLKATITMGHARAILALENQSAQIELCAKIIAKGLSVREAEALAGGGKAKKAVAKTNKKSLTQNFLENELRVIFGTKIAVNDKNNKGNIAIHYFSADERERIIELLRSVAR